jgi:uncharacterized integral membrane protein
MLIFRLLVVLLVAIVLVLISWQNKATVLPLILFGAPTPALPLGAWVLGALGLGSLTTVALTMLLRTSNLLDRRRIRRQASRAQAKTGSATGSATGSTAQAPAKSPFWKIPQRNSAKNNADRSEGADDWFADRRDNWQGPAEPNRQSGRTYNVRPEAENVVDADFRVIRPPSRNLDDTP